MKSTKVKVLISVLIINIIMGLITPLISNAVDSITVSFNTDGGTEIPDVVLYDSQSLAGANAIPEDPVKEGYTFMGWYPNTDFIDYQKYEEWSFHEIYETDTTLYALFVPNDKLINSVSINVDSPVVGDKVTVNYVTVEGGAVVEEANIRPTYTINGNNTPYEGSYSIWVYNDGEYYVPYSGEFVEGENYFASITLDIPQGSEYKFSPNLQITANGSEPELVEHQAYSWVSFIVKVQSTTDTPSQQQPSIEDPKEPESEATLEAENNTEIDLAATEIVKNMLIEMVIEGKEVEGISEDLKEKIIDAVGNGKSITVEVKTTEVKSEEVAEDTKKVEDKLSKNENIAALFNIDLVIRIDGEIAGTITQTGEELKITLPVPSGYTRIFKIYKVHNGVATELETTLSNDELSAKTNEFSTYIVTYEDVENSKNPNTGDNIIVYISLFIISILGLTVTYKIKH